MRITLSAITLAVFAQIALGQGAPSDTSADVLTIRISADGLCHIRESSMPCADVAQYLLSQHLAQNRYVHIVVDSTAKYETVAAAVKSLQNAGLKIGYVNDAPQ